MPFTDEQFKAFCAKLIAQPDIDLNDDATCKYLKTTINAPVEKCEQVDDRTVFGRFRSLYSGHAYDNTDVGEIPDSSVSLRPFFFLVYLSESGRIYVGSQYLGQFGGYGGLSRTLREMLPDGVVSHSFRHDATSYSGARPKEVRVNFSRKPAEITDTPKFGQRGAMSFKQNSSKDEEFNTTVSTKILAKLGQSDAILRKAVAYMLSGNELLDIRDDDIEDCTVVATVNGKNRTINVIEAGHFATRFPLEIEDYIKGHPDRAKSKAAMLKLLETQIIEKSEGV
ncbi:MAG: hypothetical protein ABT11_15405 [Novosphingobium sp. SCN 66-18]|nr:MAG: hypothetical protein ABT11_15405 [Novosphingobium sp. SCN 66-18]